MTICNLCGSTKCKAALSAVNTHGRHVVDIHDRFDYFRCQDCGNMFLTGVAVNADYYKRYYAGDYYGEARQESFSAKVEMWYSRHAVRARERLFSPFVTSPRGKPALLDIGCGSGSFLELLDSGRYEKYGIELNPEGVKASRAKGLNIFEGDLRTVDFGQTAFDVVTLWHVLEHVQEPLSFLKRIKAVKRTEGTVVISVPNTDGLGFRFGKQWWFHLDAPRHLFLPNRESMTRLLTAAGFQVEDVICQAWEYPLDLLWSVRHSPALCCIYPLYPLAKLLSRETLMFIAK